MYLIFILALSATGICGDFTPNDHYLLYCGPYSNAGTGVSNFDGRVWSHDENSTFSSPSSSSSTVAALADNHHPGLGVGSPFTGSRIFNSSFTYNFPVSPGPKFLRLFFYPANYSAQYDASQLFISVEANNYVLLRNFSSQLAVDYAPSTFWGNITTANPYVIKEYYITVANSESSLNLTFSPTPPTSYAFVNGIEVVSVPENLYVTDSALISLDSSDMFLLNPNTTALEMAYRLNVGGSDVSVETDGVISGMYRLWKNDEPYSFHFYGQPGITRSAIQYTDQVPNYTAPENVYQTWSSLGLGPVLNMKYNLTWRFKVDPGFNHLVRFHWCEDDFHFNTTADRIFDVYINNLTVLSGADVLIWTSNQRYVPVYKDFVVPAGGNGSGGSADLWIALHPSTQFPSTYNEVLLNGLEIFKLNKLDGSLDAPNPYVLQADSKTPSKQVPIRIQQKDSHLVPVAITGIVVGVILPLIACLLVFLHLNRKKESSMFALSTTSMHICRQFSLAQLRLFTNDFHEGLLIGRGGFGNVYKAMLDEEKGPLTVAIKRLNPSSKQGVLEFTNEIAMLSTLRHAHLVPLIGYCNDDGEMILVYEYMEHGTLHDHLYNNNNVPLLSWVQRLNACLGAAKGLQFLHSGATHMIIHRDVKSTNILLDDQWVAKLSDFGMSKLGPIDGDVYHISTAVKGSVGYLDPEYYKFRRLTKKSDVYSFGAVLLEVLCGRPVVVPSLTKERVNLVLWAQSCQRRGALDVIVDRNVKGEIRPACLMEFGELAMRCVHKNGTERPSMDDAVGKLELVLELQQHADVITTTDPC